MTAIHPATVAAARDRGAPRARRRLVAAAIEREQRTRPALVRYGVPRGRPEARIGRLRREHRDLVRRTCEVHA